MAEDPPDDGDRPAEPTDLRFVGPATAEVIEEAPFGAADVAARRVSYRRLVEAGVHRSVAERLRREYSLVWTFMWVVGDDMSRRAARLRGIGDAERAWFAGADASEIDDAYDEKTDEKLPSLVDREWPAVDPELADGPDWVTGDGPDGICPRCKADLATYSLDGSETVMCEDCGYSGVPVNHGPRGRRAWEVAVERLLCGEHSREAVDDRSAR